MGLYMEEIFHFKSWFLNALGLIHGGAYYQDVTVYWIVFVTIFNRNQRNSDGSISFSQ